jgi:hypothetical protein
VGKGAIFFFTLSPRTGAAAVDGQKTA